MKNKLIIILLSVLSALFFLLQFQREVYERKKEGELIIIKSELQQINRAFILFTHDNEDSKLPAHKDFLKVLLKKDYENYFTVKEYKDSFRFLYTENASVKSLRDNDPILKFKNILILASGELIE